MSWREALPAVRGRLLKDEPLAPFTWFRVGGAADVLFLPADAEDLAGFLRSLDPSVPVTTLGVGSNVIIRDGEVTNALLQPRMTEALTMVKKFFDAGIVDPDLFSNSAAKARPAPGNHAGRRKPTSSEVQRRRDR